MEHHRKRKRFRLDLINFFRGVSNEERKKKRSVFLDQIENTALRVTSIQIHNKIENPQGFGCS